MRNQEQHLAVAATNTFRNEVATFGGWKSSVMISPKEKKNSARLLCRKGKRNRACYKARKSKLGKRAYSKYYGIKTKKRRPNYFSAHPSQYPSPFPSISSSNPPSQHPTQLNRIDFANGFPTAPNGLCSAMEIGFSLNGNATLLRSETTSAFDVMDQTNCVIRLTSTEGNEQGSSSFTRFEFDQSNQDEFIFSMSLGYQMYGGTRADGLAFLMHQDPGGVNQLGAVGGALGYFRTAHGLIVEMDTCTRNQNQQQQQQKIRVIDPIVPHD